MGALEELVDGSGPVSADALQAAVEAVRARPGEASKTLAKLLKAKLSGQDPSEQLRALELAEQFVTSLDFTFHEQIGDTQFLNSLSRVLERPDCSREVKTAILRLSADWAAKFSPTADLLPNFQSFHARLISEGFPVPQAFDAPRSDEPQIFDSYLINEAEGQDPEEFKSEVKATLDLFGEILKVQNRDTAQTEAIISIAGNLERYAEQLQLWMERLEQGDYMREALALNDEVSKALRQFRVIRSGQ